MQNAKNVTIGVSPAYFLSRYGEMFQIRDVIEALPDIARLDYTVLQLEAFTRQAAMEWDGGQTKQLACSTAAHGLSISQFVAHWYGKSLTSLEGLKAYGDIDLLRSVVDDIVGATGVPVATVPLLRFVDRDSPFAATWRTLCKVVAAAARIVSTAGSTLALEVVPGSLAGSSFGFLKLIEDIGESTVGFNLDTGNANAAGEIIPHVVSRIGARLTGTQLCDNDGKANSSDRPGKGTVPWTATLPGLMETGFAGSLDIEIRCPENVVESEYGEGLQFIRSALQQVT